LASLVASAHDAGVSVGMIHLDITPEGSISRLGIEYTLQRACQRRGEIAEQRLVQWLADIGLCSSKKWFALCAFPGVSVDTAPHELWRSRIERRLNCIKLALDATERSRPRRIAGRRCAAHPPLNGHVRRARYVFFS
jgi:hypothetical protein